MGRKRLVWEGINDPQHVEALTAAFALAKIEQEANDYDLRLLCFDEEDNRGLRGKLFDRMYKNSPRLKDLQAYQKDFRNKLHQSQIASRMFDKDFLDTIYTAMPEWKMKWYKRFAPSSIRGKTIHVATNLDWYLLNRSTFDKNVILMVVGCLLGFTAIGVALSNMLHDQLFDPSLDGRFSWLVMIPVTLAFFALIGLLYISAPLHVRKRSFANPEPRIQFAEFYIYLRDYYRRHEHKLDTTPHAARPFSVSHEG